MFRPQSRANQDEDEYDDYSSDEVLHSFPPHPLLLPRFLPAIFISFLLLTFSSLLANSFSCFSLLCLVTVCPSATRVLF